MAKALPTQAQFKKFVRLQFRGTINMADSRGVSALTGLSREVVSAIQDRYEALDKKFPKVCQAAY